MKKQIISKTSEAKALKRKILEKKEEFANNDRFLLKYFKKLGILISN